MTSKSLAMVFGVVFLLVGILGFFNNPIVGPDGYFTANTWHNVVHLLSGILFIGVSLSTTQGERNSNVALKVFGVVYLAVAALGFLSLGEGETTTDLLGAVTINHADNWLHLALGVVILGAGLATSKANHHVRSHA